jgi:hypothetical protein
MVLLIIFLSFFPVVLSISGFYTPYLECQAPKPKNNSMPNTKKNFANLAGRLAQELLGAAILAGRPGFLPFWQSAYLPLWQVSLARSFGWYIPLLEGVCTDPVYVPQPPLRMGGTMPLAD